ncbi:MAG TPA: hypothetical protein VGG75_14835 [Trebonia sp.]|jgi:hypothetical protein
MGDHETMTALAGQVAELRARLDKADAAVAAMRARLDTETGPVMALQVAVKQIREQVEEMAGQMAAAGESGGGKSPTVTRWDLADHDVLTEQLAELKQWVGQVLRAQYPGYADLPGCWPQHREALWELSTLRAEWTRVFGREEVTLEDAQWWHERWLPGAMSRLQGAITCDATGCKVVRSRERAKAPAVRTDRMDPLSAVTFGGQQQN